MFQELPNDETVCQFCGVSYLIHHEIKRLEERIFELEAEVERACGYEERESKLRNEVEKGKDGLNILNSVLSEKESV